MSFAPDALLTARLEERFDHWILKTAPITQAAAEQDIVIQQGAGFYMALKWMEFRGEPGGEEAVDLTGWAFQLRGAKDYGGPALFDYDATIADGLITFPVMPAQTALQTGWARCVYEVIGTKGSDVKRLVQGRATLALAAVGSGS